MKKFAVTLMVCLVFTAELTLPVQAVAGHSEKYIRPNGDARNSADKNTDSATVTGTGGTYTAASHSYTFGSAKDLSGVTAGDFASFFVDGATRSTYRVRILTVVDATDTITTTGATSSTGVEPNGAGISCYIGGAVTGFGLDNGGGANRTNTFPFLTASGDLNTYAHWGGGETNAAGDRVRWNTLASGTWGCNVPLTNLAGGVYDWQGYTSTAGDGGIFEYYGYTNGAFTMFTPITFSSPQGNWIRDFKFRGGGTTNRAAFHNPAFNFTTVAFLDRGYFNDTWNTACKLGGSGNIVSRVDFGAQVNIDAASGEAGIKVTGNGGHSITYCNFHDQHNYASDAGQCGIEIQVANGSIVEIGFCNFWNNNGIGVGQSSGNTFAAHIYNSNFASNALSAIFLPGSTANSTNVLSLSIENCIFDNNQYVFRGNSANTNSVWGPRGLNNVIRASRTADFLNSSSAYFENSMTSLGAEPWTDRANGNFTLTSTAKTALTGLGLGAFTGFTNVSYIFPGSVQPYPSGSSTIVNGSYGISQ